MVGRNDETGLIDEPHTMNLPLDGVRLLLAVAGGIVGLIVLYKLIGWVFSGVVRLGLLLVGAGLAVGVLWGLKVGDQDLVISASAGLLFLTLVLLLFRKSKRS